MMGKTATSVPTAFLTLAVVTSFAIGGVGYVSGSTPEWVVLKSSIGLLIIGILGWLVSMIIAVRTDNEAGTTKGANIDVTLPETAPEEATSAKSQPDTTMAETVSPDSQTKDMSTTDTATR